MDSRIADRLIALSRAQSGLSDQFTTADGSLLVTRDRQLIDFYSGAGTLNYGHQNTLLKERLADDIRRHGALGTGARKAAITAEFFEAVDQVLLAPRNWAYQVQ